MSIMELLFLLTRTRARILSAPTLGTFATRRCGGPPVGCGTAMMIPWGMPSGLRIALAAKTVRSMPERPRVPPEGVAGPVGPAVWVVGGGHQGSQAGAGAQREGCVQHQDGDVMQVR